jgi:hypothetical protein
VRGGHAPVLRVFSAQTERESVPRHPRTPPWGTAPELSDGAGASGARLRSRRWHARRAQQHPRRTDHATMLSWQVACADDRRPLPIGHLRSLSTLSCKSSAFYLIVARNWPRRELAGRLAHEGPRQGSLAAADERLCATPPAFMTRRRADACNARELSLLITRFRPRSLRASR